MTLVSITLDQAEQVYLLGSEYTLESVKRKIRRAQDTSPFEVHPPDENDGHARMDAMRRLHKPVSYSNELPG